MVKITLCALDERREVAIAELEMPVVPRIGEEILLADGKGVAIYKIEGVRHFTSHGSYVRAEVVGYPVDQFEKLEV